MLNNFFVKTTQYLATVDLNNADMLDKKIGELINDEAKYEKASQALRRRFVRGAEVVQGVDRGNRLTRIKRDRKGGKYGYFIEGADGSWNEPEERIWVVAMYALWQDSRKK